MVRVPRSRMERTPRARVRRGSLGMVVWEGEAARVKGSASLASSERGRVSSMVRIVERVPPLAPDVLDRLVFGLLEVGLCDILYFFD